MDPARAIVGSPPYVASPTSQAVAASASVSVGESSASGRLSLGFLGAAIVGLVAFYYWTRHEQKGA